MFCLIDVFLENSHMEMPAPGVTWSQSTFQIILLQLMEVPFPVTSVVVASLLASPRILMVAFSLNLIVLKSRIDLIKNMFVPSFKPFVYIRSKANDSAGSPSS